MGVLHWIFGKHPPRPADPNRSVAVALLPRWQAELVVEELAKDGVSATMSDDQVILNTNGLVTAGTQVYVMEPDAEAARAIVHEMDRADAPLFTLRPSAHSDAPFLAEMLFEAIFVGDGDADPDAEILETPQLARYLEGFGDRPGDVAWIAEDADGTSIGAAWLRLFPADEPGYGFIDADTPELTIAVIPEWRDRGVGSGLLVAIGDGADRISLSVDEGNRATGLYRRFGFEVAERVDGTLKMLRTSV